MNITIANSQPTKQFLFPSCPNSNAIRGTLLIFPNKTVTLTIDYLFGQLQHFWCWDCLDGEMVVILAVIGGIGVDVTFAELLKHGL